MERRMGVIMALALISGISSNVFAGGKQYAQAQQLLNDFVAQYASEEDAIEATREQFAIRSALCIYCHGKAGFSSNPKVPSLAGQRAVYIAEQILNFNSHERKLKVMHDLAEGMEQEEIALLALHFSKLPAGEASTDPVMVESGAPVYAESCASCHDDREGSTLSMARLTNQHPDFLFNAMTKFGEGDPARPSATMHKVAKGLSRLQLRALSHYIASLP